MITSGAILTAATSAAPATSCGRQRHPGPLRFEFYSGNTYVYDGDLIVTNTLGSASGSGTVNVAPNASAIATLSGNGIIGGPVITASASGAECCPYCPWREHQWQLWRGWHADSGQRPDHRQWHEPRLRLGLFFGPRRGDRPVDSRHRGSPEREPSSAASALALTP